MKIKIDKDKLMMFNIAKKYNISESEVDSYLNNLSKEKPRSFDHEIILRGNYHTIESNNKIPLIVG